MRIGFDAKRYFNNFTGLGNHNRTLLQGLLKYAPADFSYFLYTPRIKRELADPTLWTRDNVHILTPPPHTTIKELWRTFGMVKRWEKDGLDIYHGLSHDLPLGIKKSKVKTIVTIHDVMYKEMPHTFPLVERMIYQKKYAHSILTADKIIAVSEHTKRDILHYWNVPEEKIDVLYATFPFFEENGLVVDNARQQHTREKYSLPAQFILSVGTIEERKNLELIIKSYPYLKNKIPLVVVGKGGAYKAKMKQLVSELKLTAWVHWIEQLNDRTDLLHLYQMARMLVYPSRYEGFGLPIVEALFCKLPVITTRASALPEAAGEHSKFVSPDDPQELANAIEQILTDSPLQNKMKEEGYRYALDRFGMQQQTQALVSIYDAVVKQK